MKKLNRILSLIVCMLLAITSLPVTQLVFAADKVVLDDDTLTSANDIVWLYKTGGKDYIEPSLDVDGNLLMTQIATSGAGTSTMPFVARNFDNIVVEESTENKTVVVANGLDGKYSYEIDLEAWIKKNPEASAGYAALYLETGSGVVISIRVAPGAITVYDGDSASNCVYIRNNGGKDVWQAGESPASTNLKINFDTTTGKIESYFNGVLMDKNNGKLQEDDSTVAAKFHNKPIKSMSYRFLSRNDTGTYMKFNGFKITQHSNAAESVIATLPATLDVENINSVTETSVTLPEIDGVTWASADENTAIVNGNVLTLIPSEEGTKEAKVTAKFIHNDIEYVKTYTMTLAKKDTPVIPEPTPDPESTLGTLVDSYVFSDSDVPGRRIYNGYSYTTNFSGKYTTDGFVLNRESATVSGTGTIPSNEFMRINLVKKVGNEYQYGLKGNYAIDLTVNGKLKPGMGKSELFLDGYIVSSGDEDSITTENDTDLKIQFVTELGFTGNTFFQMTSASDSSKKTERAPIPVNEDTVIRLIVDTVTGNVKLYASEDNKKSFEYYGEVTGNFKNDEIKGFIFNPWLGLVKGSTMTFKKIDIYDLSVEKVTFYVDDSEYETVSVYTGNTVSSLTAPAKENYVFEGWYLEGADTAFDFTKPIEDDVKLYAKYKGAPSNIVFKADGNIVATLNGEFGSTIEGAIPEVPVKEGYTAIGWFIGNTLFNASAPINATEMEVNAVYAEGELDNYTVTFNVDGNFYAEESALEGYPILNAPANPTKDNYIFKGWVFDGEVFDISNTPVTSNIILEAMFEPKDITIKYYIDEDMKELSSTGTGKYNTPIGILPIPVRNTYKFLGWKNADGTELTEEQILTEDISVYATWESAIKVVLDEDITKYGSLNGGIVEFVHTGASTELVYDNGAKMLWTNSIATSRSFDQNIIARFKIPHGDEDTENRTQVYNNKLIGDYEVEVTMDVNLSDGSWDPAVTSSPYGQYSTGYSTGGTGFQNILVNRLSSSGIQTFNNSASASSDFNATNTLGKFTTYSHSETSSGKLDDGAYKDVVNRLRYNTDTQMAYMSAPGYESTVSYGSSMNAVPAINAVRASQMACFKPGSYIRIKNIKVTQYNADFTNADYLETLDILSKLPATIVAEGDTPYEVTKPLNIPSIRGATWTSSDKNVANPSTGEITRWYDSQDVVVTATVNVGNYTFTKDYTLTIQGDTSFVREIIIDETFTSEADMRNWTIASLADDEIADYTVDENGVKIGKVSGAEVSGSDTEEKRYFAYYDLYAEAKADTYTTTSTKDVKGVYDITLKLGEYLATSKVPMKIGVGYRKGTTFYAYGSMVFDEEGVKFVYKKNAEENGEYEFIGAVDTVTVRIDNILGEVTLIKDGEVLMRVACSNSLGDNAMINTVRTALDVNNEMGDFVTIKGIKVEKVVKNEVSSLTNVLAAADTLTVNSVTANPDAVSSINALPETVGNYKVDWKSSSNQIDVETREVFFDATAKPVVITAEIYDASSATPVVVRKEFKVTVRAAANDTELGRFEIAQLGKITNQKYSDIRYDLNLPVNDDVEWKSSRTDIITDDGKVVDNVVLTEATPVTITATSKGVSKTYNLVVAPRTEQVTLSNGSMPLAIKLTNKDDAKVSADVKAKFAYIHSATNTGKVNVLNDKGEVLASMVATATGIYFDYKNSNYNEITLTDGQSVNVEFVVMPDVDKVAVFVDGVLVVDYKDLKVATDYVAGMGITNPSLNSDVLMTVNRYGMLQANIDNFNYFADANIGFATKDGINLPTDIISAGKVTWTSSNTGLIANDGTVTEPEVLTYADLEFKITDTADSRIFITKNFKIAVDCAIDSNLITGVVPKLSSIKDFDYPEKNATDNDIKTTMKLTDSYEEDSEIKFDLGREKTFNSIFIALAELGIGDFEIYSSVDGREWDKIASENFGSDVTRFVEFNPVAARFIKIVVKKTEVKDVFVNEIKAYLSATKDELARIDLDLITVPTIAEGNNINLPKEGVNGTAIIWTSSNESVIDTDGNITRPENAKTVKLTATVIINGEPVTKEFDIYVNNKSTSGPSQVGGGSGSGGGGGGGASAGAATKPIIGETTNDTVYGEETKDEEPSTETTLYSDVKKSDWYYDAVITLTEKGVVSGDGTGKFNPTDKVTREQFVKMILEAIDVDVEHSNHTFTDIPKGEWYEGYVATAVSKGIVNGIGEGKFGVGSNISRQDMAVLIERVLAYKQIEIEKAEVEPFADASSVADYAQDAVANMKAIGLIQGYNNEYNPKDNLTRAEAATVITTLLEILAK